MSDPLVQAQDSIRVNAFMTSGLDAFAPNEEDLDVGITLTLLYNTAHDQELRRFFEADFRHPLFSVSKLVL
jgi:hypothetical protein